MKCSTKNDPNLQKSLLSEPKNGTHKDFRALTIANLCKQTFHNDFDPCVEIGANLYDFSLFQTWISTFWTILSEN